MAQQSWRGGRAEEEIYRGMMGEEPEFTVLAAGGGGGGDRVLLFATSSATACTAVGSAREAKGEIQCAEWTGALDRIRATPADSSGSQQPGGGEGEGVGRGAAGRTNKPQE